jgi:FkbM family methyltransferase
MGKNKTIAEKFRFYWRTWNYKFVKDPGEIKYLLHYLSPGDIAVDIGANKGAYTYWMARAVGTNGKVFAFEPQPGLAAYLKGIVASCGFQAVTVEAIGLSSRSGQADLVIPEEGKKYSPGATLEIEPSKKFHSFRVGIDTLDGYFGRKRVGPIRFIKCDVEGHELEVFKGGENILRNDRPVVLFECESRHLARHSMHDVFSYLEDIGYRGHFFSGRKLLPLSLFDDIRNRAALGTRLYVNNFLFTFGNTGPGQ